MLFDGGRRTSRARLLLANIAVGAVARSYSRDELFAVLLLAQLAAFVLDFSGVAGRIQNRNDGLVGSRNNAEFARGIDCELVVAQFGHVGFAKVARSTQRLQNLFFRTCAVLALPGFADHRILF